MPKGDHAYTSIFYGKLKMVDEELGREAVLSDIHVVAGKERACYSMPQGHMLAPGVRASGPFAYTPGRRYMVFLTRKVRDEGAGESSERVMRIIDLDMTRAEASLLERYTCDSRRIMASGAGRPLTAEWVHEWFSRMEQKLDRSELLVSDVVRVVGAPDRVQVLELGAEAEAEAVFLLTAPGLMNSERRRGEVTVSVPMLTVRSRSERVVSIELDDYIATEITDVSGLRVWDDTTGGTVH